MRHTACMKKTFNPKKPLTIAKVCLAHGSKTVDLSEPLLADVASCYNPAVYAAPLVKGHPVLSQAVHEDTVRLSMGTVIQQGPRIAERPFL